MQTVDSAFMMSLSVEDVCKVATDELNDPEIFKLFHNGVRLSSDNVDLLLSNRWDGFGSDVPLTNAQSIHYVIMEMLPYFYDADYLSDLGGAFTLTVKEVGDYSICVLNQRVVSLFGLPDHVETNRHLVVTPDIFIAYLRGLLLDLSDDILTDDDENEDREISDVELQLYGMPAGGMVQGTPGISPVGICGANAVSENGCLAKAGACGANFVHDTGCGGKAIACGANAAHGTACGANATACAANAGSINACAANAGACAANAGAANLCGAKAGACAANATAGNVCGANAGSCGAKAAAGTVCGAKAGACGAKVAGGALCGAKAGACGVDVGGACPANAGACGVNLPGDIVSACAVNIIPLLPSC